VLLCPRQGDRLRPREHILGYSTQGMEAASRSQKSAEMFGTPQDRFGLVESISVNSAPAESLVGQKFEPGMRNIITGSNGSGKTVLARLIASVSNPDHVAEMSKSRDVDMEVRWHDPSFMTWPRLGDRDTSTTSSMAYQYRMSLDPTRPY